MTSKKNKTVWSTTLRWPCPSEVHVPMLELIRYQPIEVHVPRLELIRYQPIEVHVPRLELIRYQPIELDCMMCSHLLNPLGFWPCLDCSHTGWHTSAESRCLVSSSLRSQSLLPLASAHLICNRKSHISNSGSVLMPRLSQRNAILDLKPTRLHSSQWSLGREALNQLC